MNIPATFIAHFKFSGITIYIDMIVINLASTYLGT